MYKNKTETQNALKISNSVAAKIAEIASIETGGVSSKGQSIYLGKSKIKRPIKVRMSGEAVEIDVSVMISPGIDTAVSVSGNVQKNVKSAVQNMTGIIVSKVNVNIVGIEMQSGEEIKNNDKK
ncbi:MAG: Asp23/Gls24 family envelope stress response protein [Eubacterium sp.]|nr:Asp23/Gls24 family envelope stress response protein [Eubacterium sp.]